MDVSEARKQRKRPGQKKGTPPFDLDFNFTLKPRVVAPNHADDHNLIRLTEWVEVRVVNDQGEPLKDEKCVVWDAGGRKHEKKTDHDGVARFNNLSFALDEPAEDIFTPPVQLPDILEEWPAHDDWSKDPVGDFPKPDAYRNKDGSVVFAKAEIPRFEIKVNRLSQEQKFQHFRYMYETNQACYGDAAPGEYASGDRRWNWGTGAVCNQHVNFFLAYWFNYNKEFTPRGSQTMMTCLSLYSSEKQEFHTFEKNETTGANVMKKTNHRGFSDFIDPLNVSDKPVPSPAQCGKAYLSVEYIRMCSKYFAKTTFAPTEEGKTLIASLEDFNVYSVADIKKNKKAAAVNAVRNHLRTHKSSYADYKHKTNAQINAIPVDDIWGFVWSLDDADDVDAKLIHTLKNFVNFDHHCGILLRRAPGGGPCTGVDSELWIFSANNFEADQPIQFQKFADADLKERHFFNIGIWKLKQLRPGGYAPLDASENEGQINVHEPPRFVHWS